MLQIDFLTEILKLCKENGISTAVDTAGNVPYEYFEKIIPYTDTFLYDVKCITKELHKEFTGVSNSQILSNLQNLSTNFNGKITVRVPIIGGFNDTDSEILKIKHFLSTLKISKIEFLPYHKMGLHKYEALNLPWIDFYEVTEDKLNYYKQLLTNKQ